MRARAIPRLVKTAVRSMFRRMTGPLHFDAILHPHRSLSPFGFAILMAAISCVSFVAGLAFWLMGAWPVVGFLGLDVLLVYVAFRASYRSAREHETVQLSDRVLEVRHVDPRGRVSAWQFQPYWVRVELGDDDFAALALASHGRRLAIGRFLSPDERRDLAAALQDALHRQRLAEPVTSR